MYDPGRIDMKSSLMVIPQSQKLCLKIRVLGQDTCDEHRLGGVFRELYIFQSFFTYLAQHVQAMKFRSSFSSQRFMEACYFVDGIPDHGAENLHPDVCSPQVTSLPVVSGAAHNLTETPHNIIV